MIFLRVVAHAYDLVTLTVSRSKQLLMFPLEFLVAGRHFSSSCEGLGSYVFCVKKKRYKISCDISVLPVKAMKTINARHRDETPMYCRGTLRALSYEM